MNLSDWPGKITFGLILLVMMGCVVAAGWMGKYPPDRISEAKRWLLAIGAGVVGVGCGWLLTVLFPVD